MVKWWLGIPLIVPQLNRSNVVKRTEILANKSSRKNLLFIFHKVKFGFYFEPVVVKLAC